MSGEIPRLFLKYQRWKLWEAEAVEIMVRLFCNTSFKRKEKGWIVHQPALLHVWVNTRRRPSLLSGSSSHSFPPFLSLSLSQICLTPWYAFCSYHINLCMLFAHGHNKSIQAQNRLVYANHLTIRVGFCFSLFYWTCRRYGY